MNDKSEKREPMEAILVRVIKTKDRIGKKAAKLKTITRIAVPQDPLPLGTRSW